MEEKQKRTNPWMEAVKIYNQQTGGPWFIPKKPKEGEKPSKEYSAVRTIMQDFVAKKSAPVAEAKSETVAVAKPAGRPRKALAVPTSAPAPTPTPEPVASEKPARKSRVKKDEARAIVMDAMEKLRKLID